MSGTATIQWHSPYVIKKFKHHCLGTVCLFPASVKPSSAHHLTDITAPIEHCVIDAECDASLYDACLRGKRNRALLDIAASSRVECGKVGADCRLQVLVSGEEVTSDVFEDGGIFFAYVENADAAMYRDTDSKVRDTRGH